MLIIFGFLFGLVKVKEGQGALPREEDIIVLANEYHVFDGLLQFLKVDGLVDSQVEVFNTICGSENVGHDLLVLRVFQCEVVPNRVKHNQVLSGSQVAAANFHCEVERPISHSLYYNPFVPVYLAFLQQDNAAQALLKLLGFILQTFCAELVPLL